MPEPLLYRGWGQTQFLLGGGLGLGDGRGEGVPFLTVPCNAVLTRRQRQTDLWDVCRDSGKRFLFLLTDLNLAVGVDLGGLPLFLAVSGLLAFPLLRGGRRVGWERPSAGNSSFR